jgi:hypothetical protein
LASYYIPEQSSIINNANGQEVFRKDSISPGQSGAALGGMILSEIIIEP